MRNRLLFLALLTASLMLLPLLGLMLGLINPPHNPMVPAASMLELFQQNNIWGLLANTLTLGFSVAIVAVVLGTLFAYLAMRTEYKGARWFALLGLLPLAMPSYILAAALRDILSPYGFLGQLFQLPLFTGFFPAFITLVIITTPYVQLLVSAALLRLSAGEEEAARTLGAGRWQIFRMIILPHCRPSIAFAFLITILYVISEFGAVSVLNYPVLTWRLYQALDHQQLAQAILLGVNLLALGVPLLLFSRLLHGEIPLITQLANPRQMQKIPLSSTQSIFAYTAHATVIGIGLILPIIVLGAWTWSGIVQQLTFAPIYQAVWDSLWLASLSAIVMILLSLAPAWIVVRNPKGIGYLIEQMIYFSNALPGILLAFGLMLVALFLARFLNNQHLYADLLGSGLLLILGYTLCFLSQAYASVKSAMLRLDPRQYDSARILGASNTRYFLQIALPTLKPGLAIAFVLIFLAVLKELPVTLLLGGAMGVRPLSFRVFDRYQEAFLHDTGFAGLVLLLLSFTMMALILRWRKHV